MRKNKDKNRTQITLGLSVHRPEMARLMYDQMSRHEAIFLEEPPNPDFEQFLSGSLPVDDYLMQLDVEYPIFSRLMCNLLRKLKTEGKHLFQVEPFWEILLSIHQFFADGHHPNDIQKDSVQYPVYLAEKNATRALMAYYQTILSGSFNDTIKAIIQFARMDAARFRLRDSLRAQEIASMAKKYSSAYVEAGVMHYPMQRLLRHQLQKKEDVQVNFLADGPLKILGEKGHLFGPGDQLTLLYIYHPTIGNTRREIVLAARSIIYSKIIVKDELNDDLNTFPHLRDELNCIRRVRQLSLRDCRRLFPLVRRAQSSEAREIVNGYIQKRMPQINQRFDAKWQRRSMDNDHTSLQP